MPILSSNADLKKHVSLAATFQFPDFEPYINKAIIKFTTRYVGNLHETLAEVQTDPILAEARSRLQNAIANFGMFIYLPLGSVMFDGSGLSNVVNAQREKLDWRKERDIQRELLTSGHEAMDQLLAYMEANKASFQAWADSPAYTESKKLLVNNTRAFDDCYHIFESRQTYLALQPSMRRVEDKYIYTFLCPEIIEHLKSGNHTGVKGRVKTLLQKAIVAFTIAKVSAEGLFVIDATGLKLKFDALPYDKVEAVDAAFLQTTVKNLNADGQNYLKLAGDIITANPADFNQCAVPLLQAGDAGRFAPYNTQSTLAI